MNAQTDATPALNGEENCVIVGIVEEHRILVDIYEEWTSNFRNPVLDANSALTRDILDIINNPEVPDHSFLHFNSDPFAITNEDITVSRRGGTDFCVNYTVELFRLLRDTFGPESHFTFSKAMQKTGTGFDIIFTVNIGSDVLYYGDMSSGIPIDSL